MTESFEKYFNYIDVNKQVILDAERYIWQNPEPGYQEWKTNEYLIKKYENLGYNLVKADNIPGFYTDIDTGVPGPTVAIFGEMDSLIIPEHPECDKETGAVHSCGHHAQSAALLGVAVALKMPGALDGLCGKIRLIAIPAEEAIQLDYRQELKNKGIIKYTGGKVEFLYRGYLDGVDMAMMIHTSSTNTAKILCNRGTNGCIIKKATFHGKSCHASAPSNGRNALNAATSALMLSNTLRETFTEKDTIRFHPIITNGGDSVNVVPSKVVVESYVRGASVNAMLNANEKINRAFSSADAANGCTVTLRDEFGYAPRYNDPNFCDVCREVSETLFGNEMVDFNESWGAGCSDLGDISTLMPAIHPSIAGATGTSHGTDYFINDPYNACVQSAKVQVGTVVSLLSNNAEKAKLIIKNKKIVFNSKEDYFKTVDAIANTFEGVVYNENGTITLNNR